MSRNPENSSISHWMDNLKGDKILWVIIILLYIVSALAIFSSTSKDASIVRGHTTRIQLFYGHLKAMALCLGLLWLTYKNNNIRLFKLLGRVSFWLSLMFLLALILHIRVGHAVRALQINGAWRIISICGLQLHVFEVVKVLMVLYLAWAVNAWSKKKFPLTELLYRKTGKQIFRNEWFLGFTYIAMPIFICAVLILMGSVSSALFITTIMFMTVIIGGFSLKQTFVYLLGAAAGIVLLFGLWKLTGTERLSRFGTAESRLETFMDHKEHMTFEEELQSLGGRNTAEGQEFIDDNRQIIGAKIAIHEGGPLPFGKLPGNSTQKYKVPLIFSDYMYSFIIEEYGIFGGIFVMLLFLSLLSRGVMITKQCDDVFTRTTIGGLTLMISSQAMMHMALNVGLLPMTGQTLPIISDGKGSMLMFSFAFGVLLSMSKIVKKEIEMEDQMICNTENLES